MRVLITEQQMNSIWADPMERRFRYYHLLEWCVSLLTDLQSLLTYPERQCTTMNLLFRTTHTVGIFKNENIHRCGGAEARRYIVSDGMTVMSDTKTVLSDRFMRRIKERNFWTLVSLTATQSFFYSNRSERIWWWYTNLPSLSPSTPISAGNRIFLPLCRLEEKATHNSNNTLFSRMGGYPRWPNLMGSWLFFPFVSVFPFDVFFSGLAV